MPAPWSGVAEVRIVGQLHGQTTNNVFHFATNTVINDATQRDTLIIALLVALMQCVTDHLKDAVTSDWTLTHLEGRALHPTIGDPLIQTPAEPVAGVLSATSVSFASQLLTLRTSVGGRKGRGKKFLPPAGENETTNSITSNAVFNELMEFVNCVIGKFVGVGATEQWRLCVLSRKDLKAQGGTLDNSLREVQTITATRTLAIMSRRKVGVGS